MLEEVIWVSGAEQDYLTSSPSLAPSEAVDGLIELIRLFPNVGPKLVCRSAYGEHWLVKNASTDCIIALLAND